MDIASVLSGAQDAITVRRVFGEPYERDGVTIIPVAKVSGGGGGGGAAGPEAVGEGTGAGFGLHAEPAGVYVLREGAVTWEPAVDVNRLLLGAQAVLVALILLLRTAVRRRRRRR